MVEFGQFLVGGSAREIQVHGVVHAVGHDQLLGQSQSPGLHGVRRPEMMRLDVWICVPGNAIAAGSRDSVALALERHFAIAGEGWGGLWRRGILLDDAGACHDVALYRGQFI